MSYEVTIGIPAYQAADYIEATMQSALAQTYGSIEFLIIDDCGNDGTIDIVERLKAEHPRGSDIRILHNEHNLGVGPSRNRIIDEAQGRYLYFLDSDDVIEPDTIEILIGEATEHNADVVYASYEKIDNVNNTSTETHQYPRLDLLQQDEFAAYAFRNYSTFQVSACNCLINLTFLRDAKIRFIDSMFWEDMAFTYDMAPKVKRAILLPNITYHYQCRPNSLSNYQDREVLHREEILKNASTIDYLKWKSRAIKRKPYIASFCYDLQMNSFYIVCYILKHQQRIVPTIQNRVLRHIMRHPMSLREIFKLPHRRSSNLALWQISHLPLFLFIPVIRIMGKIKRVL